MTVLQRASFVAGIHVPPPTRHELKGVLKMRMNRSAMEAAWNYPESLEGSEARQQSNLAIVQTGIHQMGSLGVAKRSRSLDAVAGLKNCHRRRS
jgi:hypothetical protein